MMIAEASREAATRCSPTTRVAVVICSHNGHRHLPATLTALAHNARTFNDFDLILVDSASTTNLLTGPDISSTLETLRQRGVNVQCVRTEQPGLTTARMLGVQTARTELICFLDDDNVIRDGYLARGVSYFDAARCGLLISRVTPCYAKPPSPAILRRQHLLAINDPLGNAPITWPASEAWCPTLGAGMWVRRGLFLDIYGTPLRATLPDRTGRQLLSGGDIEIGIWAGRLGFDRTYAPDVALDHQIPAERLQTRYFLRLITGVVRSQATLVQQYQLRPTPSRWWRWLRLPAFITAAAAVAVMRPDPVREFLFIVAAEVAECRGPLR
jgi:GT2 family glycosyltransferase